MIFNSLDFGIFLPIVFFLYWFVFNRNLKAQNVLIVLASYIFYGWWDWRFLSLILFSTAVDFVVALGLKGDSKPLQRKLLLWTSVFVNIGFLAVFKYYNFFVENFVSAFSLFGIDLTPSTLKIILPVGISFYTFQTLSYTIDVYRKKLEPTSDFIAFAAFVSFFPQLVAGPIERATHLLPQFYKRRTFDYTLAVNGLRQILWGLVKKVVVADNCGRYVDLIFSNTEAYDGSTLVVGAVLFAFQIYGDFSGYSDIAIGTARLFGFELMQNFAFPYFSRDIAEFWRRWHISLSTWFRDYLYIPLGGSKRRKSIVLRNVLIIFIVSGFWHGANWTFIVWGALNAVYFVPLLLRQKNRNNLDVVAQDSILPKYKEMRQMLLTFGLTTLAWIFFRADTLTEAIQIIGKIFSASLFSIPAIKPLFLLIILIGFIVTEWQGRRQHFAISDTFVGRPKLLRYGFYYMLIILVIVHSGGEEHFIYFQF